MHFTPNIEKNSTIFFMGLSGPSYRYQICRALGLWLFVQSYSTATQWRRKEFESGGTFWLCTCVPPLFFGSKSTISRIGERFRDAQ